MTNHNALQNMVTEFLEWSHWFVFPNVEGRSKSGRSTYAGITDLTAIKAGVTLWIEIKVNGDTLRESQEEFKFEVTTHGGHWIECRDGMDELVSYIDELRKQGYKI
jgi:hypothetical protein